MAQFKPIKCTSSELDSIIKTEGNFILTTDTKKLYYDNSSTERLLISDDATKALQDNNGNQIDTTYIKSLSISGTTLKYTKGSGTSTILTLPSPSKTIYTWTDLTEANITYPITIKGIRFLTNIPLATTGTSFMSGSMEAFFSLSLEDNGYSPQLALGGYSDGRSFAWYELMTLPTGMVTSSEVSYQYNTDGTTVSSISASSYEILLQNRTFIFQNAYTITGYELGDYSYTGAGKYKVLEVISNHPALT